MPRPVVDALIVGAGPVGLTMAAALAHYGLSCRIVDKAPAPSDKSKALVVWSRTLELLDMLGIAQTFVQSGLKARGASIFSEGKRLVHIAIADVDSPFGYPLMLPQDETERLLSEHLTRRGQTIERQVELMSFSQRPDAVAGTLRHADGREESFEVPWLIGCDGAHSTVRHTLEIPFTGQAEPNDWMLADIHIDGPLAADELSIFWHEKGILAFFPITRGRFRVIADLGTATDSGRPHDPTLAEAQAKVDQRGPGGLTLSEPVWLAGFRINERKVSDYRRDRVFLAGDAAHIHSPAGGQGMNTGMQDAFNLSWKLALVQLGRGRHQPLLDSYSLERSAIGDQVLRGASLMTLLATLRNPFAQFARNQIAGLLTSFGFVQDKIKNALCELSINYRHSLLTAEDWPWRAGGVPAGDRMPDAPLASAADGCKSTLFAAIRGNQHALLLMPGSSSPQDTSHMVAIAKNTRRAFPDVFSMHLVRNNENNPLPPIAPSSDFSIWIDTDGRLHRRLGAFDRAIMVVRPDGYIGYRAQPASDEKLLHHLSNYLVRRL